LIEHFPENAESGPLKKTLSFDNLRVFVSLRNTRDPRINCRVSAYPKSSAGGTKECATGRFFDAARRATSDVVNNSD
jgi:hypothetical protein